MSNEKQAAVCASSSFPNRHHANEFEEASVHRALRTVVNVSRGASNHRLEGMVLLPRIESRDMVVSPSDDSPLRGERPQRSFSSGPVRMQSLSRSGTPLLATAVKQIQALRAERSRVREPQAVVRKCSKNNVDALIESRVRTLFSRDSASRGGNGIEDSLSWRPSTVELATRPSTTHTLYSSLSPIRDRPVFNVSTSSAVIPPSASASAPISLNDFAEILDSELSEHGKEIKDFSCLTLDEESYQYFLTSLTSHKGVRGLNLQHVTVPFGQERRLLEVIRGNPTPITEVELHCSCFKAFDSLVVEIDAALTVNAQKAARIQQNKEERVMQQELATREACLQSEGMILIEHTKKLFHMLRGEENKDWCRILEAWHIAHSSTKERDFQRSIAIRCRSQRKDVERCEIADRQVIWNNELGGFKRLWMDFVDAFREATAEEERSARKIIWRSYCDHWQLSAVCTKHREAAYYVEQRRMDLHAMQARVQVLQQELIERRALHSAVLMSLDDIRHTRTEARQKKDDDHRRARQRHAEEEIALEQARAKARMENMLQGGSTLDEKEGGAGGKTGPHSPTNKHRPYRPGDEDIFRRQMEEWNIQIFGAFAAIKKATDRCVEREAKLREAVLKYQKALSMQPRLTTRVSVDAPPTVYYDGQPNPLHVEPTLSLHLAMDAFWLVRCELLRDDIQKLLQPYKQSRKECSQTIQPVLQDVERWYRFSGMPGGASWPSQVKAAYVTNSSNPTKELFEHVDKLLLQSVHSLRISKETIFCGELIVELSPEAQRFGGLALDENALLAFRSLKPQIYHCSKPISLWEIHYEELRHEIPIPDSLLVDTDVLQNSPPASTVTRREDLLYPAAATAEVNGRTSQSPTPAKVLSPTSSSSAEAIPALPKRASCAANRLTIVIPTGVTPEQVEAVARCCRVVPRPGLLVSSITAKAVIATMSMKVHLFTKNIRQRHLPLTNWTLLGGERTQRVLNPSPTLALSGDGKTTGTGQRSPAGGRPFSPHNSPSGSSRATPFNVDRSGPSTSAASENEQPNPTAPPGAPLSVTASSVKRLNPLKFLSIVRNETEVELSFVICPRVFSLASRASFHAHDARSGPRVLLPQFSLDDPDDNTIEVHDDAKEFVTMYRPPHVVRDRRQCFRILLLDPTLDLSHHMALQEERKAAMARISLTSGHLTDQLQQVRDAANGTTLLAGSPSHPTMSMDSPSAKKRTPRGSVLLQKTPPSNANAKTRASKQGGASTSAELARYGGYTEADAAFRGLTVHVRLTQYAKLSAEDVITVEGDGYDILATQGQVFMVTRPSEDTDPRNMSTTSTGSASGGATSDPFSHFENQVFDPTTAPPAMSATHPPKSALPSSQGNRTSNAGGGGEPLPGIQVATFEQVPQELRVFFINEAHVTCEIVEKTLRTIAYSNLSVDPTTGVRKLVFTMESPVGVTAVLEEDIHVTATDEPTDWAIHNAQRVMYFPLDVNHCNEWLRYFNNDIDRLHRVIPPAVLPFADAVEVLDDDTTFFSAGHLKFRLFQNLEGVTPGMTPEVISSLELLQQSGTLCRDEGVGIFLDIPLYRCSFGLCMVAAKKPNNTDPLTAGGGGGEGEATLFELFDDGYLQGTVRFCQNATFGTITRHAQVVEPKQVNTTLIGLSCVDDDSIKADLSTTCAPPCTSTSRDGNIDTQQRLQPGLLSMSESIAASTCVHNLTNEIHIEFAHGGNGATVDTVQELLRKVMFVNLKRCPQTSSDTSSRFVTIEMLVGATTGRRDILGDLLPDSNVNQPLHGIIQIDSRASFLKPTPSMSPFSPLVYPENSGVMFLLNEEEVISIPRSFTGGYCRIDLVDEGREELDRVDVTDRHEAIEFQERQREDHKNKMGAGMRRPQQIGGGGLGAEQSATGQQQQQQQQSQNLYLGGHSSFFTPRLSTSTAVSARGDQPRLSIVSESTMATEFAPGSSGGESFELGSDPFPSKGVGSLMRHPSSFAAFRSGTRYGKVRLVQNEIRTKFSSSSLGSGAGEIEAVAKVRASNRTLVAYSLREFAKINLLSSSAEHVTLGIGNANSSPAATASMASTPLPLAPGASVLALTLNRAAKRDNSFSHAPSFRDDRDDEETKKIESNDEDNARRLSFLPTSRSFLRRAAAAAADQGEAAQTLSIPHRRSFAQTYNNGNSSVTTEGITKVLGRRHSSLVLCDVPTIGDDEADTSQCHEDSYVDPQPDTTTAEDDNNTKKRRRASRARSVLFHPEEHYNEAQSLRDVQQYISQSATNPALQGALLSASSRRRSSLAAFQFENASRTSSMRRVDSLLRNGDDPSDEDSSPMSPASRKASLRRLTALGNSAKELVWANRLKKILCERSDSFVFLLRKSCSKLLIDRLEHLAYMGMESKFVDDDDSIPCSTVRSKTRVSIMEANQRKDQTHDVSGGTAYVEPAVSVHSLHVRGTELATTICHRSSGSVVLLFEPQTVITPARFAAVLRSVTFESRSRDVIQPLRMLRITLRMYEEGSASLLIPVTIAPYDDPAELTLHAPFLHWRHQCTGMTPVNRQSSGGSKSGGLASVAAAAAKGKAAKKVSTIAPAIAGLGGGQRDIMTSSAIIPKDGIGALRLFPRELSVLTDADTQFWDGGYVEVTIVSGGTKGDCLCILTPEQQRTARLVTTGMASRSIGPLTSRGLSVSVGRSNAAASDPLSASQLVSPGRNASVAPPQGFTLSPDFSPTAGGSVSPRCIEASGSSAVFSALPLPITNTVAPLLSGVAAGVTDADPSQWIVVAEPPFPSISTMHLDPSQHVQVTANENVHNEIIKGGTRRLHIARAVDGEIILRNVATVVVDRAIHSSLDASHLDLERSAPPPNTVRVAYTTQQQSDVEGPVIAVNSVPTAAVSPPGDGNWVSPPPAQTPKGGGAAAAPQVITLMRIDFSQPPEEDPYCHIVSLDVLRTIVFNIGFFNVNALDVDKVSKHCVCVIKDASTTEGPATQSMVIDSFPSYFYKPSAYQEPILYTQRAAQENRFEFLFQKLKTTASTTGDAKDRMPLCSIEIFPVSGWLPRDTLMLRFSGSLYVLTQDGQIICGKELVCKHATVSFNSIKMEVTKDCRGATWTKVMGLLALVSYHFDMKDFGKDAAAANPPATATTTTSAAGGVGTPAPPAAAPNAVPSHDRVVALQVSEPNMKDVEGRQEYWCMMQRISYSAGITSDQ